MVHPHDAACSSSVDQQTLPDITPVIWIIIILLPLLKGMFHYTHCEAVMAAWVALVEEMITMVCV